MKRQIFWYQLFKAALPNANGSASRPLFVVPRTSKWLLRASMNGIVYVRTNGCIWRDAPADLPLWVTVSYYFTRWRADGTWARAGKRLVAQKGRFFLKINMQNGGL